MIEFLKGLDSATISAVLSSVISVIGAIISALIAWLVAKSSADKEIQKMKLSWKREDIISSEKEFSEMAEVVGRCMLNKSKTTLSDASGKVNSIRAKEQGELAEALDKLHQSLISESLAGPDTEKINTCLYEVMKKKRDMQESKKQQKPKIFLYFKSHLKR